MRAIATNRSLSPCRFRFWCFQVRAWKATHTFDWKPPQRNQEKKVKKEKNSTPPNTQHHRTETAPATHKPHKLAADSERLAMSNDTQPQNNIDTNAGTAPRTENSGADSNETKKPAIELPASIPISVYVTPTRPGKAKARVPRRKGLFERLRPNWGRKGSSSSSSESSSEDERDEKEAKAETTKAKSKRCRTNVFAKWRQGHSGGTEQTGDVAAAGAEVGGKKERSSAKGKNRSNSSKNDREHKEQEQCYSEASSSSSSCNNSDSDSNNDKDKGGDGNTRHAKLMPPKNLMQSRILRSLSLDEPATHQPVSD